MIFIEIRIIDDSLTSRYVAFFVSYDRSIPCHSSFKNAETLVNF